MGLNLDVAEAKVDDYIKQIRYNQSLPSDGGGVASLFVNSKVQSDRWIAEQTPTIARIAQAVVPALVGDFSKVPPGTERVRRPHALKLAAAEHLKAMIIAGRASETLFSPNPSSPLESFHPWIAHPASAPWSHGHRRDAIQRACTALFDRELRGKVERPRMPMSDLLAHVFDPRKLSPVRCD
jgi:hypothetical protein